MLNEWADADFAAGCSETGDALRTAAICIPELAEPEREQRCMCEGCTSQVAKWSRSGFCYPCANENCEHEEGV